MNHSNNIGIVRKIKEDEFDLWLAFPQSLDDKEIFKRVDRDKKWIKKDKVPIDHFFVFEKDKQFFGKICLSGFENRWNYLATPIIKDCDDVKMIAKDLYQLAVKEWKQYKLSYLETYLSKDDKHFEILKESIQEVGFIEIQQFYEFQKYLKNQIYQEKDEILEFVKGNVFGLPKIKKLYEQSRKQSLLYTGHPNPPDVDDEFEIIVRITNIDFIVALKDKEPIGFSSIGLRGCDTGGIGYICVLPQFRGNGYGKIIHRESLNALSKKGAKEYRGSTNIENYPMINIFKSNGCKKENERFAYRYEFSYI